VSPVVDFKDLRVIAYDATSQELKQAGYDVLPTADIREVSPIGIIVDSIDSLALGSDIARVQTIRDMRFSLVGLRLETKSGKKLGVIEDFSVDSISFIVMNLIVKRPAIKALFDATLVISRDKIIEVNDNKIVIKDEEEKPKAERKVETKVETSFVPNYVNPFKNPEFAEKASPSPVDS